MKKLVVILLALACLVLARPVEIAGTAPSLHSDLAAFTIQPLAQHEFIYDDGTWISYLAWASWGDRFAKWFDGADFGVSEGWIVGYKVAYYGTGAEASIIASYRDDDFAGDPDDGTLLWQETVTFTLSGYDWVEVEVDPPVYTDDANFLGHFEWASYGEPGGIAYASGGDAHDWYWYYGWSQGWPRTMIRAIVDDDVDPPYSDNQDPAPDDTNVPGDTDIVFDIVDDDAGVYGGSIAVFVDGTDVTADCDIVDNGDGSFTVTYDPAEFGGGDTVEVAWEARDVLGNEGDDSWTFTIQGDWTVIESSWGSIKSLD